MLGIFSIIAVTCLFVAIQLAQRLRSRQPKGTRQLPGPKGKFIVGSASDLNNGPGGYFWMKFAEWGKEYGPIYQYKTFGKVNVVIETEKIANELLRERGDLYSSREQLPMGSKLLSDNMRALFLPYGDEWRRVRKLQHHFTQVNAAKSYQPLQESESARLVNDIILNPGNYHTLFQRYASALILRLTYGAKIETGEEEIVRLVYANQLSIERIAAPGQYLVDVLPILEWLPTWLAPFKQEAMAHRKREVSLFTKLVYDVEKNIHVNSEKAGPSFARTWLENKQKFGLSDLQGTYVLGGLYSAAASTTASLAMSWMLMMVQHPRWFQMLQQEIDSIVGPDRLPSFDDIPQLPMVRAVVKEVARMRPVTAGGMAHKTTADDVSIHNDPELYPEPDTFNPNRWLSPKYPTYREPLTQYPNMNNYSLFGFGRRICPGAHIAERSVNMIVARMSWACNIRKAIDPATGKEITPPEYDYVRGLSTEPRKFPFELTCRSPERQRVLRSAAEAAKKDLS